MKTTPTDFRRWQLHIRKECVNCNRPDRSETIKPWSVNWTLLGRILQAKTPDDGVGQMLGPDADTLRACPDIHDRHEPSLRMARRWPLVL